MRDKEMVKRDIREVVGGEIASACDKKAIIHSLTSIDPYIVGGIEYPRGLLHK